MYQIRIGMQATTTATNAAYVRALLSAFAYWDGAGWKVRAWEEGLNRLRKGRQDTSVRSILKVVPLWNRFAREQGLGLPLLPEDQARAWVREHGRRRPAGKGTRGKQKALAILTPDEVRRVVQALARDKTFISRRNLALVSLAMTMGIPLKTLLAFTMQDVGVSRGGLRLRLPSGVYDLEGLAMRALGWYLLYVYQERLYFMMPSAVSAPLFGVQRRAGWAAMTKQAVWEAMRSIQRVSQIPPVSYATFQSVGRYNILLHTSPPRAMAILGFGTDRHYRRLKKQVEDAARARGIQGPIPIPEDVLPPPPVNDVRMAIEFLSRPLHLTVGALTGGISP